jgi:hypothetical protein
MKIVVFAEHFKRGDCESWEHRCSARETKAVMDSACAHARSRSSIAQPTHNDFLDGARQVFDTTRGAAGSPGDGDLQVYCVCLDKTVIGLYEKISHYSQLATEALESTEPAFKMSA